MTHEKEESRLISCSCKSAQKVTCVTCSVYNIIHVRVFSNQLSFKFSRLGGLIGKTITMPCWLPDGKDASDIVCFSNELLSIEKLISKNEQAVKSHTPAYFGSDCVEYAYNPAAECPMWVDYLQTTFDDEDSRMALQMMFGYILSGKIDKNIGFFLIGRGGDGKSVAAHILRKLVGENQTCCLPFANLVIASVHICLLNISSTW